MINNCDDLATVCLPMQLLSEIIHFNTNVHVMLLHSPVVRLNALAVLFKVEPILFLYDTFLSL